MIWLVCRRHAMILYLPGVTKYMAHHKNNAEPVPFQLEDSEAYEPAVPPAPATLEQKKPTPDVIRAARGKMKRLSAGGTEQFLRDKHDNRFRQV
ncbi:MAG: hypothetical protein K2R98_30990 [Gemmataceae bacterium]|nr:hypothetical protein [Gemmataceae bacterium]